MDEPKIKLTLEMRGLGDWTLRVLQNGDEVVHDLGCQTYMDALRAGEFYLRYGLPDSRSEGPERSA